MKLLFATTNQGKLAELRALVEGLPVEVVSLADVPPHGEVVEDGETFAENAQLKALAWARRTGLWALADDSGLCVDALGGEPGVHSARYSEDVAPGLSGKARDEANIDKLLTALAGLPAEKRGAEFRSALALAAGERRVTVEGQCRGRILDARRGTGGFGYDPVFEVADLRKSFGELTREEKNRVSHRAAAFRALRPELERILSAVAGR